MNSDDNGVYMPMNKIITTFLCFQGKILIMKRSQKVSTMKGKWAGVSGYLECEIPLEQAYKEIYEETRISKMDLILIQEGDYLDFPDSLKKELVWRVYPFLFEINKPVEIILDWEHDELKWIDPKKLNDYDTIPELIKALKSVMEL